MEGTIEMALCLGQFVPHKGAQQPGTTTLPRPQIPKQE